MPARPDRERDLAGQGGARRFASRREVLTGLERWRCALQTFLPASLPVPFVSFRSRAMEAADDPHSDPRPRFGERRAGRQACDRRVPARRSNGGAPAARAGAAVAVRRAVATGERARRLPPRRGRGVAAARAGAVRTLPCSVRGARRARARQGRRDRGRGPTARGEAHRARRGARQHAHPVRGGRGHREGDRAGGGAGRRGGWEVGVARRAARLPVGLAAALGLLSLRLAD